MWVVGQKHSETERENESDRHRHSVKEERENTEYTHINALEYTKCKSWHFRTHYVKATLFKLTADLCSANSAGLALWLAIFPGLLLTSKTQCLWLVLGSSPVSLDTKNPNHPPSQDFKLTFDVHNNWFHSRAKFSSRSGGCTLTAHALEEQHLPQVCGHYLIVTTSNHKAICWSE